MTIKNVVDFYFNNYDALEINIEKWNGLEGKSYLLTKKSFYETLSGWLNEEVISVSFETHFTNYSTKEIKECKHPHLYILHW